MALFEARIGDNALAGFSRRMSTSLSAGLDILGSVERERNSAGPSHFRQRLALIYDDLRNTGCTFSEAVTETGRYFPPLFRELSRVGEETGHLPETLRRVADHLEYRIRMRRTLLAASFWPLIQLAAAIFVLTVLIFVQGMFTAASGEPIDVLNWGLRGTSGALIFLAMVGALIFGVVMLIRGVMRGMLWTRAIQKILLRIPVVGKFLESVAMSNLGWSMGMTFNTGLDVRRAVPLALGATNNSQFTDVADEIVESTTSGQTLYESFSETRVFPVEFLDTLHTGEVTGTIPESMAKYGERCQETAQSLLQRLAVVGGFGIWIVIAGLILWVIYGIAQATLIPYYQTLDELSQGF